MTHRIGNILYISPSVPEECSVCKMIEECRPYTADGSPICLTCAHNQEGGLQVSMVHYAKLNEGVTSVEMDPDFVNALRADLEAYDALEPLARPEALVELQNKWHGKSIGWLREQVAPVEAPSDTNTEGTGNEGK